MTSLNEPRERQHHHKTAVFDPLSKWSAEQVARLGFLVGLGWSAKRISEDPILFCSSRDVYKRASRYGLSFLEARAMAASDLPPEAHDWIGEAAGRPTCLAQGRLAHDRFGEAAKKRGLTRTGLGRRLLREIAMDPHLVDNILDDDFGREDAAA
jgi:hypothetical protein